MHEQKVASKEFKQFIMDIKEECERNSHISKRFFRFINGRPTRDLRPINIVDRVIIVMETSKVILREEARVKIE